MIVSFDLFFQPLTTVGPPLDFTGEHKISNEALEPVPLAELSKRPVGGISVEESRDLMQEADLVDRKVERERIRNKHKEQKLKIKKRQREEQVRNLNLQPCHCCKSGPHLVILLFA